MNPDLHVNFVTKAASRIILLCPEMKSSLVQWQELTLSAPSPDKENAPDCKTQPMASNAWGYRQPLSTDRVSPNQPYQLTLHKSGIVRWGIQTNSRTTAATVLLHSNQIHVLHSCVGAINAWSRTQSSKLNSLAQYSWDTVWAPQATAALLSLVSSHGLHFYDWVEGY